jgi:2-C-methyl-D-erythritol 4-phosphate cytidylyltransferase
MGAAMPKQFLEIAGRAVLVRTIERMREALPEAEIVVVLPEAHVELWRECYEKSECKVEHSIALGGATRFDSVQSGIAALSDDCSLIAVHDGVRPMLSVEMIRRGVECAAENGAAVPVIAVVDSIREVDSEGSHAVDRSRLRAVQTPQVFRSDLLRRSYEAVGANLEDRSKATDDASVVEMAGYKVALYEGESQNLKLTTPTDLSVAEVILANGANL